MYIVATFITWKGTRLLSEARYFRFDNANIQRQKSFSKYFRYLFSISIIDKIYNGNQAQ